MAALVRADMTGRVALSYTEANKLFAMYRDQEGVIHLRPIEEPNDDERTPYVV